jgi:tetratricopeptide (TPR) repeat protein
MQAQPIAILEEVSKANPSNASLTEFLGEAISQLAADRKQQGDPRAALKTYRSSHKIFADLLAADPKNFLARANFAFSDLGIADSQLALRQTGAALKTFREAATTFEEMSAQTISNRYPRTGLARAYSGLAATYSVMASGKDVSRTQARAYLQEAHSDCEKSVTLWSEKEKRGELESGERRMQEGAAQCVTEIAAKLGN